MNITKSERELAKTVQLVVDKTGMPYEMAVEHVEQLLKGMLDVLDKRKAEREEVEA